MISFLQFNADKSDRWKPYTVEQLENNKLPSAPTFQTVLLLDQDPEQLVEQDINPIDTVKYFGPMYLDFDDAEDIDRVLDEVRLVIDYLKHKLDIPEQYINCWLSGGKGVHITIASELFGVKNPVKFLPLIYREIMLTIQEGAGLPRNSSIDDSVYSLGRGRMWRCEGYPRPGKGTYKVATTPDELDSMDEGIYHTLVAAARPALRTIKPGKEVSSLKCIELYKRAKAAATKRVRAMNDATTVPKEALRLWEGIPGCIHKLITEGDQAGSNWNQAAMQLASYIAARYERSEEAEYTADLIEPFVRNVESSSRNSESERRKHVKEQLNRTFRGSFKLSPGAIISVIGSKCGNCPICRSDLASGDTDQQDADSVHFHAPSKIAWDSNGYWKIAENGRRQLTSFTFWVDYEVFRATDGTREGPRIELQGRVIDDAGNQFEETIRETAWGSKKEFLAEFKGLGEAQTFCGDADLQYLLKAIMYFSRCAAEEQELGKMTRSNTCGIFLEQKGTVIVPHYIEADGAITNTGRSHYKFDGQQDQSPMLLPVQTPVEGDEDLEIAISSLCQVNEPVAVALTLGWHVACHFRQHIQHEEPQFPLLNLNGNAGSGKTSMAVLMGFMNGIDYVRSPYMNVEVGTMYPLQKYLTSSTTVPRLVEEVNPLTCGNNYHRVIGLFKASWNRAPINRGQLRDREMSINDDRVQAPIIFTSEQSSTSPAIRDRTVEVTLKSKTRTDPKYKEHYQRAVGRRFALMRLAKALLTVAMNTPPRHVMEIFRSKDHLIKEQIADRPRWSYQTCLTGLHMLVHTMKEYGVGGVGEVEKLEAALVAYLGGEVIEDSRGKSASEVGRVLEVLNTLADETTEDKDRLKPGLHYWKQGDSLYLVLQSCHPNYLRYCRSIGDPPVIRHLDQLNRLISGEVYHLRTEPHPGKPADVFVVSVDMVAKYGTNLNNFQESEYAGQE